MQFLPPKDFQAKLISKETLNDDTISLWFEPQKHQFTYFAGQFIMLKFHDQDNELLTRAYSIASAPNPNNQFELCVGLIPNGKGSNYIANLQIGDTVDFKGPFGVCYLKPENQNNLICVATGTGIAPVKAILEDLANHNDTRSIDVLFGVRTSQDFFYLTDLKQLADKLEDSNIMLTLSQPDDLWTGYHGRVTAHLPDLSFDPTQTDFYICGNKAMIKEVREFALQQGVPPRNIHIEIFD